MEADTWLSLLQLGLGWMIYFFLHSALASSQVKGWVQQHLPELTPFYRLLYNLIALAGLAALLAWQGKIQGPPLWAPGLLSRIAAGGLALMGGLLAWRAMRHYDLGAFAGLRQTHTHDIDPPENLSRQGLNAYVRHPLYTATLIFLAAWLLWSPTVATLVVVVVVLLYLRIGIHFEEKKLIATYGSAYRDYRARVPMLFPRLSALRGQS